MVEFHVLCCSNCITFQVLQVTKTNKWKCKICNQKQSILKVYGVGTGMECRKHVQKLNLLRGELNLAREESALSSEQHQMKKEEKWDSLSSADKVVGAVSQSRWSKYADTHAENASDENKEDHKDVRQACENVIKVTTDWTEYKEERKRKKKLLNHSHTDVERTEAFHTSRIRRGPPHKLRKTAAKQSSIIHEEGDGMYSASSDDSQRPSFTPLPLKSVGQGQFGDGLHPSLSGTSLSEINGTETVADFSLHADVSFGSHPHTVDETAQQQVTEDNRSLLLTSQQRQNINISRKSVCDSSKTSVSSKWGIFLENTDDDQRDDDIDQDIDGKLLVHLSSFDAAKVTGMGNGKVNTNIDTFDGVSLSKYFGNFTKKGYAETPPNPFLSTSERFINASNSKESLATKGFAKSSTCKLTFFPSGQSTTRKGEPKPLQDGLNGVENKKPIFDLQHDLDDVDFDL